MVVSLDDMARQLVHMERIFKARLESAEAEIIRLREEVANTAAQATAGGGGGGGSGPRTGDERKGYKDGLRMFFSDLSEQVREGDLVEVL